MMADLGRLARSLLGAVLLIGAVALPSAATGEPDGSPTPLVPSTESTFTVDTVTPDLGPQDGPTESTGGLGGTETGVGVFTTIGASYASASPREGLVRVHTADGWGRWFELHGATGSDHGPDPDGPEATTARPASDPIWVGEADGYELALPADASGVQVHLVRPTGESAAVGEASDAAEAGAGAAPTVRRRAAWGARPFRGRIQMNRRLVRGVVHHTVNANTYTAGQVPSMLRSIQAYHQDTRGWSDIAYNFVVDRFGTIWEARARSYDRAVVGAASSGTNLQTVAVAFLGDATAQAPPSATLRAIGRTLGWKMRKHGLRPTRANIIGHRDVGQTACPGDALYRQLPAVERVAVQGNPAPGPFLDVPWTRSSARSIDWAARTGIIPGFDDGRFRPQRRASRADAYVWLWRFAGSPPGGRHPFVDIPADAPYRDAVKWASAQGIARGRTPTRFAGARLISRQGWVDLLWRYMGEPAVAVDHPFTDAGPRPSADWAAAFGLVGGRSLRPADPLTRAVTAVTLHRIRPFDDRGSHGHARAAVDWARAHVILSGYPDHTFRPDPAVTRQQASNWLWRFLDRPASGPVDPAPGGSGLDRATAVTWLWEAAGSPPRDGAGYPDEAGTPHEMAATWTKSFRLFPDFASTTFGATEPVTRGQLVRALFRLADRPAAWAVTPPGTVRF